MTKYPLQHPHLVTNKSHSTDTKAELKIRGLRHHSSGDEQYSLLGYDFILFYFFLTKAAT